MSDTQIKEVLEKQVDDTMRFQKERMEKNLDLYMQGTEQRDDIL